MTSANKSDRRLIRVTLMARCRPAGECAGNDGSGAMSWESWQPGASVANIWEVHATAGYRQGVS